ncbi:urease accessory protein [Streptomyces sp. NWU49]|uniref:urease accessory protein UreD n=1 Tax=Streptomyces sp. NWU49 TaxID=2201153 RepID=UPI000D67D821|nr:urease accessory protein UreD [Streptomyces sp. NWU49]PWJ04056.1 urease accessory protein [Streptomyces sp. NWU49]
MTRASARLATERTQPAVGRPRTRISVLRSDWPLMLRTTSPLGATPVTAWAGRTSGPACVHVAAGAAGPLGGDRPALDVHVGPSRALLLGEVAPTLLLPGTYGEESRLDIRIRVGTGAALAWLPELVIAGRGCRHVTDIRIVLEAGARLVLREEVLFGRHGEAPGAYRRRVRVETEHGPVYDQELGVGPAAIGWNGPAVTAGRRTAGTLIAVDPDLASDGTPPAALCAHDTAVMALPGGGVLVSTLASETTALRRQLDHTMAHLLTRTAEQGPAAPHREPARHVSR